MGQLFRRHFMQTEIGSIETEARKPLHILLDPFVNKGKVLRIRPNKVFHLHLFKLPRAKDKVARGDLVAKRLAYLGDAKRNFTSHCRLHVEKVNEDALGRFWS